MENGLQAWISANGSTYKRKHKLQVLAEQTRTIPDTTILPELAWMLDLSQFRITVEYESSRELPDMSYDDIVDTVQSLCGTLAAQVLQRYGRTPTDLEYEPLPLVNGPCPGADTALAGMDLIAPDTFAAYRLIHPLRGPGTPASGSRPGGQQRQQYIHKARSVFRRHRPDPVIAQVPQRTELDFLAGLAESGFRHALFLEPQPVLVPHHRLVHPRHAPEQVAVRILVPGHLHKQVNGRLEQTRCRVHVHVGIGLHQDTQPLQHRRRAVSVESGHAGMVRHERPEQIQGRTPRP